MLTPKQKHALDRYRQAQLLYRLSQGQLASKRQEVRSAEDTLNNAFSLCQGLGFHPDKPTGTT